MEEKINVYSFDRARNKSPNPNCSVPLLKKKLILKYGKKCYICKNELKGYYELEHKIPVEIGGKIFCLTNLGLVCSSCHSKKTIIDKKSIKIIKDIGMLEGKHFPMAYFPLNKLRDTYLFLFNLIKDCKHRHEKWYYGTPEEDYNQLFDKSNREVEE